VLAFLQGKGKLLNNRVLFAELVDNKPGTIIEKG